MNTTKSKFLLTTAVLLAGVSLASAQGMREGGSGGMSADREAGGGAAEHGRSGAEMSHGAGGAAHSEGMAQGRAGGRTEGIPAAHDSDRTASKGEQTIGHGRGERDNARQSQSGSEMHGKDQTVGQSKSDRDQARQSRFENDKNKIGQKNQTIGRGRSDRDNARQSRSDSDKSGQKEQTAGQSGSDRTRQSQGAEQNKSATTGGNTKDNAQGRNAQGQSTTTTGSNANSNAQGQAQRQAQGGTAQSMSGRVQVNAQQQAKLQQSVLNSRNVERVRVNDNAIHFRVDAGVVVPRNISVVSVSAYPALIDIYPDYRDDSFFVVDDEIVITDRSRRIVDVIPAGPRTHFAHRGSSSGTTGGSIAALDLSPDEIRVVQRVLIERGLLSGEADGILGPDTRAALISFQRQEGFQTTGSIDTRTVAALGVSNQIRAAQGRPTTVGQGRNGEAAQQHTTGQGTSQNNAPEQQNQTLTSGQAGTSKPSEQTTGQAPARDNNQSTSQPGTSPTTQPGQNNQNSAPPPSTSGQPAQKQPSR
ncbi:peptidoglycan-binding protein [Bradyrhizobium sp. CCBAU 45384]|uniref:peptidoglycan-binding protein n=1 Tax=Bradyrhizobium sp. CCBAU 45384 TaxID=858428 RepID=UPI0023050EB3|nr:peptidoglycan-binding protein [Bradyrhizobium sp. CCBAU 45384]MDA9408112.1 hypothetical protein [Bradyrhizobium sp. CCBAU 45384]